MYITLGLRMQLDLSLYFHAFMELSSPAVLSILAENSEAFRTRFGKSYANESPDFQLKRPPWHGKNL
jgi:hypothetical protein